MSAESSRWRRIALRFVGHASWVLPGARSGWADAMQRELDYIEDDQAALRWAIGCVTASYSSRLAALPRLRWRIASGPVLAGSMLFLIAMALQGHASDEASPAASDETSCDLPDMTPDTQPLRSQDRGGFRRPSQAGAGCIVCPSKSTDWFGLKSADTPGVAAQAPLAVDAKAAERCGATDEREAHERVD
jgi:hypothetical protein